MKDLIRIERRVVGIEEVTTVNARELWQFVESKQQFSDWIKGRIETYGFAQGIDFTVIHKFMKDETAFGGQRKVTEYHLSVDMGKELAMVENNEKGREVRRYFIECEKQAKAGSYSAPLCAGAMEAQIASTVMGAVIAQLNLEGSAKLGLVTQLAKVYAPSLLPAMPVYAIDAPPTATLGSSAVTKSATELLKESGCTLSARAFNVLAEEKGLLSKQQRRSKKGAKEFWTVTEEGMKFGKNVTSPNNPLETQPHWYVETFADMLTEIS